MADSKRKSILTFIEGKLASLSSIKHAESNRLTPYDLEVNPFPVAFVYSGPEQKLMDGRAVIGQENWLWTVIIEVWAKDSDMEDLLKEIHDLLYIYRDMGGNAVTSDRMGSDMFVVDPARQVKGMSIDYEIIFRHTKGVM